jgi:TonB family protein
MPKSYIFTAAVIVSTLGGFLTGIAYQGSRTMEHGPATSIMAPTSADLAPVAPAQLPARQLENVPRPRTLKAAMAQALSGKIMRRAVTSNLDASATPFGAYDRAVVEAISQRWYDLLDARKYQTQASGNVTVSFNLQFTGQVSDTRITESTVSPELGFSCTQAINQSAPFAPWPSDMRRMVGAKYREVKFTFNFH